MLELMALAVPALPLAGVLAIASCNTWWKKRQAGIVGSAMPLASFLITLFIWLAMRQSGEQSLHIVLFNWFSVGGFTVPFSLLIDHLTLTMMMIVTGVGALIHIYSIGYMQGDERFNTFFQLLNLFTFSMLLLIMGGNYLILFIGWEGVGICSYLLIGFWFKNNNYNYAARKAFIMNRIGDLGFILGILLMSYVFKTLVFEEVFAQAASFPIGSPIITAITLLLLIGALGKSAQIPLFTWLPDAMAGPTPVSALIHAATMVTAGIYMIARSGVLYNLAPITQQSIVVIGLATAIIAAITAVKQNDIKKVLAYSTVSQLGYMFIALGMGAYSTALFHVTTHAFFKALLFLAAGSVIHAMGGEQDIRKMGGLRQKLPVTWATFLIATLAITGFPPFAGFFSKDLILSRAFEHSLILYVSALAGALLTCFYMFRLLFLVFWGENRLAGSHPHESPAVMTVPLIVLAIFSTLGGFINLPEFMGGDNQFAHFLQANLADMPHAALNHSMEQLLTAVPLVLLAGTLLLAYRMYVRHKVVPGDDIAPTNLLGRLAARKFYLDELYSITLEKPYGWLSDFLYKKVESKVLEPIPDDAGLGVLSIASLLRRLQKGNMSFYLFAMVAGILLFIVFILIV